VARRAHLPYPEAVLIEAGQPAPDRRAGPAPERRGGPVDTSERRRMSGRTVEIERIVLVGLSGAGKSTVARLLAARLGWAAADSDDWIVAQAGRSIADLFASEGEPAFREREHAALRTLCERPGLVLATGGGVVTVEANWPLLRARSRVVWLRASPEQVFARLAGERGDGPTVVRPLLASDPLARLRAMAAARRDFYARADVTVDTDGATPAEVAERVLAAVLASGARPSAARADVIRRSG
jgi:shikimate kinase